MTLAQNSCCQPWRTERRGRGREFWSRRRATVHEGKAEEDKTGAATVWALPTSPVSKGPACCGSARPRLERPGACWRTRLSASRGEADLPGVTHYTSVFTVPSPGQDREAAQSMHRGPPLPPGCNTHLITDMWPPGPWPWSLQSELLTIYVTQLPFLSRLCHKRFSKKSLTMLTENLNYEDVNDSQEENNEFLDSWSKTWGAQDALPVRWQESLVCKAPATGGRRSTRGGC